MQRGGGEARINVWCGGARHDKEFIDLRGMKRSSVRHDWEGRELEHSMVN